MTPTVPYRPLPSLVLPLPLLPSLLSRPIAHPPDPSGLIITDQQCPIRHHQQPRRPAPPVGVRADPAHDEILDAHGQAALYVHPHDLAAGRHRAIPRAV